jgi:hypothetical protein
VEYDELSSGSIDTKEDIDVVVFQNVKYIHKLMDRFSCQRRFETEVLRYGIKWLPRSCRVEGGYEAEQGLLLPYIEGDELWNLVEGGQELPHVTDRIIEIARNMEKVGVYHEELKCQNIIKQTKI